jgi:RimJ/RimL family protein N-acetyltransferase
VQENMSFVKFIVAEKIGFVYEDRAHALRQWQGEWLDLLHFGMLREEWQGSSW